jgi:hypothetical protein
MVSLEPAQKFYWVDFSPLASLPLPSANTPARTTSFDFVSVAESDDILCPGVKWNLPVVCARLLVPGRLNQ